MYTAFHSIVVQHNTCIVIAHYCVWILSKANGITQSQDAVVLLMSWDELSQDYTISERLDFNVVRQDLYLPLLLVL